MCLASYCSCAGARSAQRMPTALGAAHAAGQSGCTLRARAARQGRRPPRDTPPPRPPQQHQTMPPRCCPQRRRPVGAVCALPAARAPYKRSARDAVPTAPQRHEADRRERLTPPREWACTPCPLHHGGPPRPHHVAAAGRLVLSLCLLLLPPALVLPCAHTAGRQLALATPGTPSQRRPGPDTPRGRQVEPRGRRCSGPCGVSTLTRAAALPPTTPSQRARARRRRAPCRPSCAHTPARPALACCVAPASWPLTRWPGLVPLGLGALQRGD